MSEFLNLIQPSTGYTEVRAIKDGKVRQYFTLQNDDAHRKAIELSRNGWDAYYGVLKRNSEDGADVEDTTPVLWADLDAKHPRITTKQTALSRLLRYDLPPSVIVDSGHGYHAYWCLNEFAPWANAETAMRGLAKLLDGDHVYDAPRILRLPETMNWKDPQDPVLVRLIRFDVTRRFRFSAFHEAVRAASHETRSRPEGAVWYTGDIDEDLPGWLDTLIREGAPQGTRSEQSFKVMCSLMRRGWTDRAIWDLFETSGIGEKYREKGKGGERWMRLSLSKARQEIR